MPRPLEWAVLAAGFLLVALYVRRFRKTIPRWTLVEGRIEALGRESAKPRDASGFSYSYVFEGSFYGGHVDLSRDAWEQLPEATLVGRPINVMVYPKDPAVSAVVADSIPGLRPGRTRFYLSATADEP